MNITVADIQIVDVLAEEGSIDAAILRVQQTWDSPEGIIEHDTARDMVLRAAEILTRLTPPEIQSQGFAASCSYHRYLRIERTSIERGDTDTALKCRVQIEKLRGAAQ